MILFMETFSKGLQLSGLNSTTSMVLNSMIIFLVVLISVLAVAFYKQLKLRGTNQSHELDKKNTKGF